MVVADDNLLIDPDCAVVYFTDTDTPDIVIIVNGADKYLCACIGITFGSGNVVQNGFKQRRHVGTLRILLKGSDTGLCGCEYKRTVKL